jgi:hypothetical protein
MGSDGMHPVVICRAPDEVFTPAHPFFRPVGSKWTPVMRWNHNTPAGQPLPDIYMQVGSDFPHQTKSPFTLPFILGEAFGIKEQGFEVDPESCWLCFAYGPKNEDLSMLRLTAWNTLLQGILDLEDSLSEDPKERKEAFANMAIRLYSNVPVEHSVIPIEERKVYVVDNYGDLQEVPPPTKPSAIPSPAYLPTMEVPVLDPPKAGPVLDEEPPQVVPSELKQKVVDKPKPKAKPKRVGRLSREVKLLDTARILEKRMRSATQVPVPVSDLQKMKTNSRARKRMFGKSI